LVSWLSSAFSLHAGQYGISSPGSCHVACVVCLPSSSSLYIVWQCLHSMFIALGLNGHLFWGALWYYWFLSSFLMSILRDIIKSCNISMLPSEAFNLILCGSYSFPAFLTSVNNSTVVASIFSKVCFLSSFILVSI